MKNNSLIIRVAAVLLISIVGCAPGPNQMADSPDKEGEVAGFWRGLWHGIIVPVTFIVSLFKSNLHIYEVHNSGNWYNLGFLIGVSMIFGGSGGGACRRSWRK